METQTYIRKPFEVQAVQVTEENMREVAARFKGRVHSDNKPAGEVARSFIKINVENQRNDRQGRAYVGDWVTETRTGVKIYTDGAFKRTFDPLPVQEVTNMDLRLAQVIDEASHDGLLVETNEGLIPLAQPQINLKTL